MTKNNKRFQNTDLWIQDRSANGKTYFLDEYEDVNSLCELLNGFEDDIFILKNNNQKLQERNDNQYKQLSEIYELLGQQDWVGLAAIVKELEWLEKQYYEVL